MAKQWTQAKMREVAEEERAELRLKWFQPLDPYALATSHGIPVYPIAELADEDRSSEAVRHFTEVRQNAWSAALIPLGRRRIMIENTAHSAERRRSNIAHELGHHLLEHSFDSILLTDDGCRRFDKEKEKQAKFMSAELLLPWKAAMRAAFDEKTNEQIASAFGVSTQFVQMRMSGARVRASNALARQGRQ
ncbi:ImmA/IrrE family metallo-endopeptidase [Amycolatopsis sp. lyj-108]|uniref:ImmA/IrrE family metallo-endopeptidase n=1 Tax=Amycolatopsis sp. lyj-108 TaxID=2789286 RepID=UPI0039795055